VRAERVPQGVDVRHAVAPIPFGDPGGLEVRVENADGQRVMEEFLFQPFA
jgi:predicted thioesterase